MELRNLILVLALMTATQAAPLKNNLVRFYPISRAQYDAILSMTAGQPLISEGRLISSGLRTLENLRTAISSDISTGWHQLLNITGLRPIDYKATQQKVDGYPLCVIKTSDLNGGGEGNGEVDENLQQARSNFDDDDEYEDEEISARNDDSKDYEESQRPVVNCIVVVRKPEEGEAEKTQQHQKEPQNVVAHSANSQVRRRFRRPAAFAAPYFYPPYAYPAYPFYGYPYYPEARHSVSNNKRKSMSTRFKYYNNDARNAGTTSGISAETASPKMADKSTGRSGYAGYYPGSYGGYGGYGNYYQQGYPYSAGYAGGCQHSYNPYGSGYYGGGSGYYRRQGNDDDSGEESDVSGEVAGEIGGGDFD